MSNCSRDLRRHICTHLRDIIEPYYVEVPLQTPQGERYDGKIPLLLPHELASCLFLLGWAVFAGVLLGGIPESTGGSDVRSCSDSKVPKLACHSADPPQQMAPRGTASKSARPLGTPGQAWFSKSLFLGSKLPRSRRETLGLGQHSDIAGYLLQAQ